MNKINSEQWIKGTVKLIIDENGQQETFHYNNTVLMKGREALASCLANQIGDEFEFYINRMIFGDQGTSGGVPKYVHSSRTGLFGATVVSKPVISSVDPDNLNIATFTSVISRTEGNGYALSEMALQMANGHIYSMVTFPDISKTSSMQLTWSWSITIL
jgi:hypothetical protein